MVVLFLVFIPLVFSGFDFSFSDEWEKVKNGQPSGAGCAGCSIGITLVLGISEYRQIPLSELFAKICSEIFPDPGKYRDECEFFVELMGPLIIEVLEAGLNPDETCRKVGFCSAFPQCGLHPPSSEKKFVPDTSSDLYSKLAKIIESSTLMNQPTENPVGEVPYPVFDNDDDYFGTTFEDRGSAWRGKDCNDSNSNIYPGRKVNPTNDPSIDYNCNGIHGIDQKTGQPWEDVLCEGEDRRGIIVLGDSLCAHFRIPQQYFSPDVSGWQLTWILQIGLLEMDWPHLGFYVGHLNDTTGLTPGEVRSLYMNSRELNRCNHRDYQAICINGMRSGPATKYIDSIKRDANLDHPAIFFLALVGDDVCTGHHDFHHFTTPTELRTNTVEMFGKLEKMLPKDSHVVLVGLADGTLLWQFLHDRIHPIGHGITYTDVYTYLNCLECSPCWGWMNQNETIRKITQQAADELSKTYQDMVKEYQGKYDNFKLHYISFGEMCQKGVKVAEKLGIPAYELAEPVDGFHASQQMHPILSDLFYDYLQNEDKTIFGKENPKNKEIEDIFGNQGGY